MIFVHIWVVRGLHLYNFIYHCNDIIMGAMASQITSPAIVYSSVYSGSDQRKHQSSASLAFVRGIHRSPENYPRKWPVTRQMFPFDDIITIYSTLYIKINYAKTHLGLVTMTSILQTRFLNEFLVIEYLHPFNCLFCFCGSSFNVTVCSTNDLEPKSRQANTLPKTMAMLLISPMCWDCFSWHTETCT